MERTYYRTYKKANGAEIKYPFKKTIKGTTMNRKPMREVTTVMENCSPEERDAIVKMVKEFAESKKVANEAPEATE